jgi:hypothetical protein
VLLKTRIHHLPPVMKPVQIAHGTYDLDSNYQTLSSINNKVTGETIFLDSTFCVGIFKIFIWNDIYMDDPSSFFCCLHRSKLIDATTIILPTSNMVHNSSIHMWRSKRISIYRRCGSLPNAKCANRTHSIAFVGYCSYLDYLVPIVFF